MSPEEQKRKALEERESQEGATFDSDESVKQEKNSLGKAETHEQKEKRERVENYDNKLKEEFGSSAKDGLHVSIGYSEIPLDKLPSKGKFYPNKTSIQIRAAAGQELEHWSTMIEDNQIDVDKHFKDLIYSCMKFKIGTRTIKHGNLLEADKLYILLAIQEKTFDEQENRVVIKTKCSKCGTDNKVSLTSEKLEGNAESEELIEKYYDPENKRYSVQTKNFGELHFYPPSLGTMDFIYDYVGTKNRESQYYNKALLQLLPYLIEDFTDISEKDIISADTQIKSWDKKKLSVVYRLIEMIKVGVKPTLSYTCSKNGCGSKEETPVRFPDGPKSLFLISDIEDELL